MRRRRITAVLAAAALCLALASSASAKPMLITGGYSQHQATPVTHALVTAQTSMHSTDANTTSATAAGPALTPAPTASSQTSTNTSDSGGLSTLAIVLIAVGGALAAASLGAFVARHSRAGIPST